MMVEVTHNIPSGFTSLAATQPAGKTGAVTPSKFSFKTVPAHGVPVGVADGVTVAVAVGVGVGVGVPGVGVGVGCAAVIVIRPLF